MLLSQIIVYPIKSLDGVSVNKARLTSGGILEFDRVYAIVDESGAYVNAKRTARVQRLRTIFDEDFQEACFWQMDESSRKHFSLVEPGPLNKWLSEFFGFAVKLVSKRRAAFRTTRRRLVPRSRARRAFAP